MIEAARIDGAGEFRIFFQIALRMLAPGFVTVVLFTLVATWNNYFLPLIMLNDPDLYPITVGLAQWAVAGQRRRRRDQRDLLPGDHRFVAVHHPADRRLPDAAAVLAVRPGHRRRQAMLIRFHLEVQWRMQTASSSAPRTTTSTSHTSVLKTDLDLMADARFTVIRVGESVWSTWEPENGRFDLDWLQPVLDGAHERGIAVVLGTPTYAVPPWLARLYPEIAGERATGQRIGWGARQEVDFTHPASGSTPNG